jgi:zinc D-Ala-D-Ala dipeptidase
MDTGRTTVYQALENQFLTYRELQAVPVHENSDPMVGLKGRFSGRVMILDERMREFTGDDIYVRKPVAQRLDMATQILKGIWHDAELEVVYGYRHLDIQTAFFEVQKERAAKAFPGASDIELAEAAHRFTAVPEVAGHPTGGAVDLRVRRGDGSLAPMGTEYAQFDNDTYVFSPFIARECWHNRQILRYCLLQVGFAPFDGEWWHFSFGDREWAKYFFKPAALYSQIRFCAD